MKDSVQKYQETPVIAGGWELIEDKPHLIGTKCKKCGNAFFPPRYICSYCLMDEGIVKARLGNQGRLYAYTVINIASREFNPPYAFGYVVIEPENIRIPALLSGVNDPNELSPGTRMEMVIEKLRDDKEGNQVMTFKFRPMTK